MHELNRTISKIDVLLPPVEYIKNILQVICDHLGYSFATVIEVDGTGEAKMLVSCNLPHDYPERINKVDAPILSSPSGEAIETGRIVVVTDPLTDSRLLPWIEIMREYSIRTGVWIPLFRAGKAFGTCVLYDTKKHNVPEKELAVLEHIGVMVSIAITSNQYLRELSTEIEERKVVEAELRQMRDGLEVQVESRTFELSKANAELRLFRNLIDQSNDAIFVMDPETSQFLDVNESACLNLGYRRGELLGKTVRDIAPVISDMSIWAQHVEEVRGKGHMIFVGIHQRKDGTTFPVEINVKYTNYGQNEYMVAIVRDITERNEAKTALNESEKRYKGLFNSANDGIFIHDLDGQFIDANNVACEYLGYTHDELTQMTVMDLHAPQDVPKIKSRLLDVFHHDYIINEVNIERDGRVTSLEIKSQLIESDTGSAILSIARDITERRQAEKALKKSDGLFRALYTTMNEGVASHEVIYNESGEPVDYRILDVNPAFESILGIKKEDAKGVRATELYGTSEAPYLDTYAKVAATGESITFESAFEQMDKFFKIAVFSPGLGKFATLFADITERKKLEDALNDSHTMLEHRVVERTEELEIINRKLSDANVKLRELDVMKSEFLDTISHELRTPLTSIIGYSGLLLDGVQGDMNEKQIQYVEGIWRKGMHQLQLVNDILDVSKLESCSMSVTLESVSISKTIEDAIIDMMPLLKDKQHETFVEIAEGVSDVYADGMRLKQVLLNLISNAIKFTPDNGKIIAKANNEGEMVRISIIDNGMGIQQEDVDKLFNRFIQIDQSNTRSVGGTGLGLAIVKDLIELMGGSVELKSEFNHGSTFSILLPIAQSSDLNNE